MAGTMRRGDSGSSSSSLSAGSDSRDSSAPRQMPLDCLSRAKLITSIIQRIVFQALSTRLWNCGRARDVCARHETTTTAGSADKGEHDGNAKDAAVRIQ